MYLQDILLSEQSKVEKSMSSFHLCRYVITCFKKTEEYEYICIFAYNKTKMEG